MKRYGSGVTLRKTSKHDGSNQRFYAFIDVLGCEKFTRISKDEYHTLNNLARVKCAFTTNIKKIQYNIPIQ